MLLFARKHKKNHQFFSLEMATRTISNLLKFERILLLYRTCNDNLLKEKYLKTKLILKLKSQEQGPFSTVKLKPRCSRLNLKTQAQGSSARLDLNGKAQCKSSNLNLQAQAQGWSLKLKLKTLAQGLSSKLKLRLNLKSQEQGTGSFSRSMHMAQGQG